MQTLQPWTTFEPWTTFVPWTSLGIDFGTTFQDSTTTSTPEIPWIPDFIVPDFLFSGCYQYYNSPALNITTVIMNSISLFVILSIGTLGIIKINGMDKIDHLLKLLFHTSVIAAATSKLSNIIRVSLCFGDNSKLALIFSLISTFGYLLLLICVLGTLLVRLITTFEQSVYAVCPRIKKVFTMLFICLIIVDMACLIMHTLTIAKIDDGIEALAWWHFVWILQSVGLFIYTFSSIWAVWIFSENLLKLARSRTATFRNAYKHKDLPIQLNQSQLKLINMTAKYVSLFTVAITSSCICITFVSLEATGVIPFYQVPLIVGAVDGGVNILCLYMQYVFAADHYEKYCGWIDDCCQNILARNMSKDISELRRNSRRRRREYEGCPTSEETDVPGYTIKIKSDSVSQTS